MDLLRLGGNEVTPWFTNSRKENFFSLSLNSDSKSVLISEHQCPASLMPANRANPCSRGSKIFCKAFTEEWKLLEEQIYARGFNVRFL